MAKKIVQREVRRVVVAAARAEHWHERVSGQALDADAARVALDDRRETLRGGRILRAQPLAP